MKLFLVAAGLVFSAASADASLALILCTPARSAALEAQAAAGVSKQ